MKSPIFISFLLLCGLTVNEDLRAEATTPETAITTDSIDIFARAQGPQKSAALAMAASLVLPGSGHQYLGQNRSALVYISADVASIFGYFFCTHYAQKLAVDASGYAWLHAGAQGPSNTDNPYWSEVGSFPDAQTYNTVMDLNRTSDQKIISPDQVWHWDDQSSQDRFNALRASSRRFQMIGNFFLGAMVINRVVAFIDARAYTHNLRIKPQIALSSQSVDVSLEGSF